VTRLHRVSPPQKPDTLIDVIFVHGLGGHYRETWTAPENAFWPTWLDEAVPAATVYSLEYDASPSEWLGGSMPLTDRANNVLALLDADGIGKRPLVFVTHSLGGLVVKQLLRHSDSIATRWKHISEKTVGVVFLATPHQGSDATKYVQALKLLSRPTIVIRELEANAAALRDLNLWYRNNVNRLQIENLIFF
jgi:triacylglycerol esterase/lipase EstA (alpha/beta hydrolase family)